MKADRFPLFMCKGRRGGCIMASLAIFGPQLCSGFIGNFLAGTATFKGQSGKKDYTGYGQYCQCI
jgi:hypothetical protein